MIKGKTMEYIIQTEELCKYYKKFKALDGVEGIQRYRISSLEPDLASDELISAF